MSISKLRVVGMTCGNCVRHVTEALLGVPGVCSAEVTLEHSLAVVDHDGIDPALMIAAIGEEGYEATEL